MTIQDFIFPRNQSQQDMREEWISHLIYVNAVGVNKILSKYGYTGRLQPTSREDTVEAIEMCIEQNGTDAIRDLLMIQPEFEAIRELLTPKARPYISTPQPVKQPMLNATGNEKIAGILDVPVNDIVKGAIVFGIIYLLTKKL